MATTTQNWTPEMLGWNFSPENYGSGQNLYSGEGWDGAASGSQFNIQNYIPQWNNWEDVQSWFRFGGDNLAGLPDSVKQQIVADPYTFMGGGDRSGIANVPAGYEHFTPGSLAGIGNSFSPEYAAQAQWIPGVGVVAPSQHRQWTEGGDPIGDMVMAGLMAGVGGLALSGAGIAGAAEGAGGLAEGFSYGGGGLGSEVGGAYGGGAGGFGEGALGSWDAVGGLTGQEAMGMGGGYLPDTSWTGVGGSGGYSGQGLGTLAQSFGGGSGVGGMGTDETTATGMEMPSGGSVSGGSGILDWIRQNPTLVGLGGTLAASGLGALGSYAASNAQQQSAANSLAMLERMYNQNRADLEPWRTAGVGALGNLTKLTTPGAQFDQAMLDPGYQFRLGEGSRAIDRAASARGRYYAPATMQALDRYNQNFATNEFGNVFNRNATLAGLGQVGTTAGVNAGQNYANNAANITQSAGDARASGYMGMANAVGGGIGQGVNYLNQQALLEALLGGRT